jgi:D-alanine--D-alanine ligase
MTKLKVAVLMGGTSAEREVSLATGRQILNALDTERYDVYALDTASGQKFLPEIVQADRPVGVLTADDGKTPVTSLAHLPMVAQSQRPDVVVIALHGKGGEDGTVQGFLETLNIPYTGSGVLASALAMDKVRCKALLSTESIQMPVDIVFERWDTARLRRAGKEVAQSLGFPVIVKPSRQGSSFGAAVVDEERGVAPALDHAFRYDDTVLVEQHITGTEITVAVLGNRDAVALPIIEIVPPTRHALFDYEAKYSEGAGAATEIVPARLPEDVAEDAKQIALACHRILGCRGMSRTDMFVTPEGDVVTLEVNTIPGMTQTSLLPKAAAAHGISFPQLIDGLITLAREPR